MEDLPIISFLKKANISPESYSTTEQTSSATPPPKTYIGPEALFRRFSFSDAGSDVQSRFNYQAACVAIYATRALLENDDQHDSVYCEVLEDFLLRNADGRYVAVQVKTREKDLEPFKTSDKEILSTLVRFSQYESNEGESFYRYVIATNAGFWKGNRNWKNLHHVRKTTTNAKFPLDAKLGTLYSKIVSAIRGKSRPDQQILANVFRKLELDNQLPHLGAEHEALRSILTKHLDNPTIREIDYIVANIIEFVRDCSDRSRENSDGVLRVISPDPDRADIKMLIESRKITKSSLVSRLETARKTAEKIEQVRKEAANSRPKDMDQGADAFTVVDKIQDQPQFNSTDTTMQSISRPKAYHERSGEIRDFTSKKTSPGGDD